MCITGWARRGLLARSLFTLWVCIACVSTASAERSGRPNIVLIIGDDHAWDASGFMGHEVIDTPHLDALAEGGTTFTQGQSVASVCRPSLITISSGLHLRQWDAKRAVLETERPIAVRQEIEWVRTLPRELARRGYVSWEGGKWWDGTFEQAGFDFGSQFLPPGERAGSTADQLGREGWDPAQCGPTRAEGASCPALDSVRDFLEQADTQPFFMWFAPKLPHAPWDPPIEFIEPYAGEATSLDELLYFAQVTRLDAVIGELIRVLEDEGVIEDTLIVYVSDNGYDVGQGLFFNLMDGKGSLHELGTRTPIIFSQPMRVPAGVVREDMMSTEDLLPTLLDFAGMVPPSDRNGHSWKQVIEDGAPAPRTHMVSHFAGHEPVNSGYFLRSAEWRYIAAEDGSEVLHAIRSDPYEEVDVSENHPDVVAWARQTVLQWSMDIDAPATDVEVLGRLVDGDGEAVAAFPMILEQGGILQQVQTDGLGWFRFAHVPIGDHILRAAPHAPALVSDPSLSLPVGPTGRYVGDIETTGWSDGPVPTRTTLEGRVFDRFGQPVGGARVRVARRGRRLGTGWDVRTGPEGHYLVEGLRPGYYDVIADGSESRHKVRMRRRIGNGVVKLDLRSRFTRAPSRAFPRWRRWVHFWSTLRR